MTRQLEFHVRGIQFTPKQWEFILDDTRFKLLAGGRGAGKSTAGAAAFLRAIARNQKANAMMVAPTMSDFEYFMRPAFLAMCPEGLIVKHVGGNKRYYVLATGQRVYYRSAFMVPRLEGINLGAFWGDEARYWRRSAWDALMMRLRVKDAPHPQGILTSSPEMNWLHHVFFSGSGWHKPFRISTRENAANLDPDYIPSLEQNFSAKMCQSVIEGEFMLQDGRVFESFNTEKHILDWPHPRQGLNVVLWIDFGFRHSSVLFVQEGTDCYEPVRGLKGCDTIPPRSLIVFDELQAEDTSTQNLILMIDAVMKKHGIKQIHHIYCDPAGHTHGVAKDVTSVDLLEDAYQCKAHYQEDGDVVYVPTGVMAVESVLAPFSGPPRLYFDRGLMDPRRTMLKNDFTRGVIPTLQCYGYKERRDGRPASDHPQKEGLYEHAADALRYGVINSLKLSWSPPPRQGNMYIYRSG
jgi:hypothetical protein